MNPVTQTSNGNTRVLILATLAFAVCFAGWALFSPLAVYFKVEFNLSSTKVGLLLAMPVLLGSIARVPIGVLTDKYGGRRIFSILLLFGFFPMFIASFANSYWFLLIFGFFFLLFHDIRIFRNIFIMVAFLFEGLLQNHACKSR